MVEARIAVAYMSAANKNQDKQSESINTQREAILAYASKNEFLIEAFFDDTVCEDETLKGILGFCKGCTSINYLIVSDSTRISRDARKYFYWKNAFKQVGVEIVCAKKEELTPMAAFMQGLMEMFACDDTHMRSEIVKNAMAARAKEGFAVQQPPYGYALTGTKGLYKKTNTAGHLGRCFKQVLDGKITAQELRKLLSAPIHPKELISNKRFKRIVSNPYYAGYISFGGELYEGIHDPILTPKEQQRLIELLDQ